MKKYFSNILFWIVLFFIIRLYGITNPPIETAHNWRQTTVTMAARNFLEIDNNIFYPRIDIAGEKTGITGMEFPILNYAIYLVSEVFGYQHWYGRLINLIITSIGLFFFFLLIKKYFKEKMAFTATLILMFSLWFCYARKIMPDTFSMSFIFAAIYFGSNYLENKEKFTKSMLNILLYAIMMMIGVLSKLPSAFLLVVFSILIFNKTIELKKKVIFIFISLLCMIPVYIWYFYWVPMLLEKYEFWHFFMGKSISEGSKEILSNLSITLKKFYSDAMKYTGFAMFIIGLVLIFIKKEKSLFLIFLLSFISFLFIMLKAGITFSTHSYYILPFVPIMALIAAYSLSLIKNNIIYISLLLIFSVEGLINQYHDFILNKKNIPLLNIENELNKFSIQNDLILINSGNNPTPMYFAHRKGWVESNENILNDNYIADLKSKGLKFIVILKTCFGENIDLKYEILSENNDFKIYKL